MKKKIKILIIDDNEELLSALAAHLKLKDFSVVTANNGLDGIKILDAEKTGFDLVITDLVMPNISGIGVISIIKKRGFHLPVIAITGWGEHPERLAAEAEADLVLEKPFNLYELDKHIERLLYV